MIKPRVAILVFPGTNSEEETFDACADAGLDPRFVLWSEPAAALRRFDAFVLSGGFAYEDRVRAGAIAAKLPEVALIAEQAEAGKLVLGLCNGAQVLAEAGLLGPIAIARNLPAGHFQCRFVDVSLSAPPERCAFTVGMQPGSTLRVAMAHGEGRFCGDSADLDALEKEQRIVFRYCGHAPNGAMHDAAAVCNAAGNVLAIMPHPERAAWTFNVAFADARLRGKHFMDPAGAHAIFQCMAQSLKAA